MRSYTIFFRGNQHVPSGQTLIILLLIYWSPVSKKNVLRCRWFYLLTLYWFKFYFLPIRLKTNRLAIFFFLGLLVIVSLLYCTPYFYYIPKSALAAIIIAAVIFMVEIRVVKPIYRSKSNIF